jgi:hypothetical protein
MGRLIPEDERRSLMVEGAEVTMPGTFGGRPQACVRMNRIRSRVARQRCSVAGGLVTMLRTVVAEPGMRSGWIGVGARRTAVVRKAGTYGSTA